MEPKAPGANCAECSLKTMPFVPTYAPENAKLAIVGEGPGVNEAAKGIPFVGQSGRLVSALVERNGVPYEEVWRSNIVACRPPNNRDPTSKEVACCYGRFMNDLDTYEGEVIMPLGKVAGDFFMRETGNRHITKVTERRGHWFHWEERDKWVVPTWHPAYVLRRPSVMRDLQTDVKRAIKQDPFHPLQEQPSFEHLSTVEELEKVLAQCPPDAVIAFDLETDQTMWYDRLEYEADDILMMGMTWGEDNTYILTSELIVEGADQLNDMFAWEDVTFVAHNGKFDVIFLEREGVHGRVDFDTMLAHYALSEETGGHGLKSLALEYYGLEDYEEELVQKYLRSRNDYYSKVPYEELAKYCAWDVAVTRQLKFDLEKEMIADDVYEKPFKMILMPAQKALTPVEIRGVPINTSYVRAWQTKFFELADRIEDNMGSIANDPLLNPRSPKQVSNVVYNKLGLPRPRARGVKPDSTSKKALSHIKPGQSPFIDELRQYRRVHKMNRSYLKNLLDYVDANGRVHPSALIHGTEVGRLSFRNPAIQTIPRPYEDIYGAIVRAAFQAPPGWLFVLADYSQAELRVVTILSEEPFLLDVYQNDRDLHTEVAIAMYGQDFTKPHRVLTKMFNFSYIYGGSEYSFAEEMGLPIAKARQFVRDYNALMPTLVAWKVEQFKKAKTQGYVVSPFGRKRRFPLIVQNNVADVRKAAAHAPVAGTASDLTQLSLMRAEDEGLGVVLTVHDSIGLVVPEDEAHDQSRRLQEIMVSTGTEYFPQVPWKVDVDIRRGWSATAEKIHGEKVYETFGYPNHGAYVLDFKSAGVSDSS